jgi:hypothetical protein
VVVFVMLLLGCDSANVQSQALQGANAPVSAHCHASLAANTRKALCALNHQRVFLARVKL